MQLSLKLIFLACLFSPLNRAQVNILTANGSNDRTNSNLQETQLSPTTVTPAGFGKLGVFPVDGQVYSQPLIVSGLSISGGIHNVVFLSTMHNSVVTVWATGAGELAPDGVDGAVDTGNLPRPVLLVLAEIGGQAADVLYAGGAPGMVEGVIQVNLRIPPAGQAGAAVPVVLRVGISFSQFGITLAIQIP